MWGALKKLWRWFSELDTTITVFSWIKLGTGVMASLIAGFVAWLDAQPVSILFVLALAALLIAVFLVNSVVWLWGQFRMVRPKEGAAQTEQLGQDTDIKTTQYSVWSALAEKDPANTLVILSAGIERIRLQGDHPAWEIFFTAYNGGVGEVRLISAGGSFKVRGQAYPTPVELKSATPAKHGEITLFTVRQWIDQRDVPQEQQGQNHVVLQLSDLKIEAIATDPVSGNERPFIVPLPDHLQFDVRHHWNIGPDFFSRFYRERLGADGLLNDEPEDELTKRRRKAEYISEIYAESVEVRNNAFSLRVLDGATETKMDDLQAQLLNEMRDLAPERSINLETINVYDQSDHPRCLLQEPSRTRAMQYSEVLLRVMKILDGYN